MPSSLATSALAQNRRIAMKNPSRPSPARGHCVQSISPHERLLVVFDNHPSPGVHTTRCAWYKGRHPWAFPEWPPARARFVGDSSN